MKKETSRVIRDHNKRIGKWGEEYAEAFFVKRGWHVLERNVRTPYGELDLVIKQEDVLVFVEVKTRTTESFGFPEVAVSSSKQTRLIQSAEAYLQAHPEFNSLNWRIDVIAIQGKPEDQYVKIEWFDNAVS